METKIKKVLLIINPVSGDTEKQPIINMVRNFLRPGTELKVHETSGRDDINEIRSALKAFRPDRILVAGGDGTIKVTAQACEGTGTIVGILPAGSANGLATDLGLPLDYERAVVPAMGYDIIKMDALRIGDSIGLHISDFGINAELIKKYSESSVRGHFGYFLSSVPTLFETECPYDFTIRANGSTKTVKAVMVAFANSKKFGTGALVNPNGKVDDGKFEVLIFKKLDVVEIFRTLEGNIEMDGDFVEVIQTTDVKVTTDKPVNFQIDGEPSGTRTEVSVSIIPNFTHIAIGS